MPRPGLAGFRRVWQALARFGRDGGGKVRPLVLLRLVAFLTAWLPIQFGISLWIANIYGIPAEVLWLVAGSGICAIGGIWSASA